MDKPLRLVTIFGLLLVMALMIQVNYLQGGQAEDLQKDPLNNRQFLDTFKRPRGKIMAGGETLVFSEKMKGKETYARFYKEGQIFAPVTGFYNGNFTGLERAFNTLLDGRDKRITQQKWFDQFIGKPAIGADLETTIIPKAQRVAYNALRGSTSRRAGAAVVDIKTGQIVVLAGFPSFDPNLVAPQTGLKGGRVAEILAGNEPPNATPEEKTQAKKNRDFTVRPLEDKAANTSYPPGSAFKTVMSALAMEQMGLNTQSVVPTGSLKLPSGRPLPNSHESGACSGQAPLLDAYAESCNATFAKFALQMGIGNLKAGADKFGFDKPIPIEEDMKGAPSRIPDKTGNGPLDGDDLGRTGIGQSSVQTTPLQMALVAAAVANNGKIMKPYLVQRVRAANQNVVYEAEPELFQTAIKNETADQIKEMMIAVVRKGTARGPLGGQDTVAGKTGTAEQGSGNPNARSFVGFSPINSPRYAFCVTTEGDGSAAGTAGPLALQIMQAVLAK